MSSSLFSQSWYRVADVRPRLRRQAQIVRQTYRGERWYVLQDQGTGRFLRLNPAAYRLVALMDGNRSLSNIWHHETELLGDEAPTQDEVLHLLAQLHQANVLISDHRPDLGEMEERRARNRSAKLKQYFANPLSIKFPLADPDNWISAITDRISSRAWFWIMAGWLLLILSGLVGAFYYWDELTHDLTAHAFTAQNMMIMAVVFPVLKGIHELGHALAIKAFRGSCREIGLMFLVFVPVPYVDASQATRFSNKYQRMLVGAAGMMIELAVASLALWIWTWVQPGLVKALLHETVILAGVTTLVFNANPLLRFDGYYILTDWLEIPNLGQKSNQFIGFLLQRHCFGADQLQPPHLTPRENLWLPGFAVASFFYRMLVAVGILLLVFGQFFFIGVLMGMWVGWSMLLQPLVKNLGHLANAPELERHRHRAWVMTGGFVSMVLLLVFFIPAPSWTSTEGVIWMPEDTRLRAMHPCFGRELLAKPGTQVKAGAPLMSCSDPELDALISQNGGRQAELEARLIGIPRDDRVQGQIVAAELGHARQLLADLVRRRESMVIASPTDGIFVMNGPSDFEGRFLGRGEVVAFVTTPERLTLISVVSQGDVDLVRKHTSRVELRVVGDVWRVILAKIEREVPAATQDLPSLALTLEGGGKVGLDPTAKPEGGARALTPLFQFELALTGDQLPNMLGQRVYVRFVHESEPLAEQWFRVLRQLFLKRFTV
jgi:putative peptide zinc metalloprotease protein